MVVPAQIGIFPAPVSPGYVFNQNFTGAGSLSNFILVNGTPGSSFTLAGHLVMDVPNGLGGVNDYIQYNVSPYDSAHFSSVENQVIVVQFANFCTTEPYKSIGLYLKSKETANQSDLLLFYDFATDVFALYHIESATVLSYVIDPTVTAGFAQIGKMTLTINKNSFSATAEKVFPVGPSVTISYSFPTTGSPIVPDSFVWALYCGGGHFNITTLSVLFNTAVKFNQALFIGDSNTKFYYCSTPLNRYASKAVLGSTRTFSVLANPGVSTSDLINCIPEVLSLRPKYVFVMMGTNDPGQGINLATYLSNMATFIQAMVSANIHYVVLTMIPCTFIDFTSWKNALISTYPETIDCFTGLAVGTALNPAYTADGGLHLNDLGAQTLANILRAARPDLFYV